MLKKIINFRNVLLFLPFIFTGFISTENNSANIAVENYYNFQFLKNADSPYKMKVINTSNIQNGKSLIEYGVLVTYKNRKAKNIDIAGDFSNWQLKNMSKGKYGVWYYFIKSLEKTRYKFIVDGIWINDPLNDDKEDDSSGSYLSVVEPGRITDTANLTYRIVDKRIVEFRIYRPKAKFISIVGDFNNWNPENDLLEKDNKGIWKIKKQLFPGAYKYKYIIDGEWMVDLYNPQTARDNAEGICSLIKIEK